MQLREKDKIFQKGKKVRVLKTNQVFGRYTATTVVFSFVVVAVIIILSDQP